MIIYKITNIINDKIYVGCTTKSLNDRWKRHIARRKDKNLLARAITKYGEDNFSLEILDTVTTKEAMFLMEIYWIKKLKSNDNKIGYNLTEGGDCGPTNKGKNHPMFGKKNLKLADFNRSRKGIELSDDTKIKLSKANKGKQCTQESKVKMSNAAKQRWLDGAYVNISETMSKVKKGKRSNKRISIKCLNNNIIYDGYTEAALKLGLSSGNISNVVNGKFKHTKGFKFEKVI